MKITTILTDVGGVLTRTESTSARRLWEEKLHLNPGELTLELTKVQPAREATVGFVNADKIWQNVARKFSLDKEELFHIRRDYFAGEKLNTEFYSYVQKLHESYRVVLFTNAWDDGREIYIHKFHLDKICDQMIISAEEKMRKPHKKFFKRALDLIKCLPSETVYIDDTRENIKAGQEMGFHSILFRNTSETIEKINVLL